MSTRRELIIHRAALVAERAVNEPPRRHRSTVVGAPVRAPTVVTHEKLSIRTIRRRLRRWLLGLDHRARGKALRRLEHAPSQDDLEKTVIEAVNRG